MQYQLIDKRLMSHPLFSLFALTLCPEFLNFVQKLFGLFHSKYSKYSTRAIISRSRFEAALVYNQRILSFKKESRNNGPSAA
jgi:hypothetical protein